MKKGDFIEGMNSIDDKFIEEADSYSESPKKAVISNKKRKKGIKAMLIAAAAALLAAAGVFSGIMINRSIKNNEYEVPEGIKLTGSAYYTDAATELPEALSSINVTADGTSSRIISPSACLLVTTAGATDTDTLVQYLSLSPQVPVTVTQTGDTDFVITPASGSFAPGTLYKVTLGDPENPSSSYAFQTESQMIVKSRLPADKATSVPVNSGIEITFSEAVSSSENFSKYFSISPSVSGKWVLYPDGRTVAFVPNEELKYDTVYEYTVKEGLCAASGRKLEEGCTVKFKTVEKTAERREGRISVSLDNKYKNLTSIFSTEETPYIHYRCYFSNLKKNVNVTLSVYKYPTAKDAYNSIIDYEKTKGDEKTSSTSGLIHITDITQELETGSATSRKDDIYLPSGLEKGVYLVRFTAESVGTDSKAVSWTTDCIIQISDMVGYTVSSDGRTLLYLYNKVKGNVTDASVTGTRYTPVDSWNSEASDFTAISFKNASSGVYETDTGDDTCMLCYAESGSDTLLVCAGTAATDTGNYTMKYMYTDRETYFGTDTVNFWGYIVPAYEDSEIPDIVYLQTSLSTLRTPIYVDEEGYFSGSYSLENMSESYMYLKITDEDGNIITSKSIYITDEEKPTVTASFEFDKLFYTYGETAEVTLTATFYDGTPVNGIKFSLSTSEFSPSVSEGTTDSEGKITFKIKTGLANVSTTDYTYIYVYAELVGFETQTLNVSDSFIYFNSDYIFESVYTPTSRTLTLNKRDFSVLKTEEDIQYPVFDSNTIGAAATGKVKYTLYKVVTVKTAEKGYDTYSKRSYTYYNYTTNTYTEDSGTFTFENGKIELPMYTVSGFTGYYYYTITFNDGRRNYEKKISAVKYSDRTDALGYQINELKLNSDYYSVGDSIEATMWLGSDQVENALWIMSADGIDSYFVGSSFSTSFTENMIPGARLYCIFFSETDNAFNYHDKAVNFNYEEKATLNVEIIPDMTVYKPGASASVKLKVTDSSGKPVTSGRILLSVVDEACFALGEQQTDSAKSFFKSLGSGLSYTNSTYGYLIETTDGVYYPSSLYYSAGYYYGYSTSSSKAVVLDSRRTVGIVSSVGRNRDTMSDGEATDGGTVYVKKSANEETAADQAEVTPDSSTYVRSNFADNPEFVSVEIGSDGTAVYVFTVPDNITSWRITACAVTGNGSPATVQVGDSTTDVICTQSFFINAGVCSKYIVGDDISLSARSYGSAAQGKVSYTAILYAENGDELKKLTSKSEAQKQAWFNFGKLEAGSYSAVIYGECEDSKDALRVTFEVAETAATCDVSKDITLDQLKTLSPVSYPLTLTFHSAAGGYSSIDRITNKLIRRNTAGRSDTMAAKYVALSVYENLYGTSLTENAESLLSMYSDFCEQDYISLLSYSEEDPALTARILAVCPEIIPASYRYGLASEYYSDIGSSVIEDDVTLCASLLGLAALEEPILDRLYSVAAQAGNYSLEAKLYLCGAFAAAGDYSAAAEIWAQLKAEYGVEDTEYGTLYIKADTLQEKIRYTSIGLIAASRFSKTDASAMAEYLLGNYTSEEPCELALAAYLRYFAPAKADDTTLKLTYTLDGKTETVEISRSKSFTLKLTKSEFAAFSIDSADSGITIHATYGGTAEEALEDGTASSRIKVEKEISPEGNGIFTVTLKISGTSTRVSEHFSVNDWIPSGARYLSCSSSFSNNSNGGIKVYGYIYNTSGQEMGGYIRVHNSNYSRKYYKAMGYSGVYTDTCDEYSFDITLSYQIRGAVAGEFIVEPAVVSNYATNVYSISERMKVVIDDPTSKNWKFSDFLK